MPDPIPANPAPTMVQEQTNTKLTKLKISYLIIGLLLLIILSAITISLAGSKFVKSKNQKSKQEESAYQRILNDQEKRNKTRTPSLEPQFSRAAKGSHVLHVIYIKPPRLNESTISQLIEALNYPGEDSIRDKCINGSCYQAVSLKYINKYLNQQARTYGIREFNIAVKTHPVLTMDDIYKVGDIALLWDKDMFGITKLQDGFDNILSKNNITIKDGELIAFLYLDDTFDQTTTSSDRFYEHKKFRSFADYTYGKTYLNIYKFEESFSSTAVEILTHELLHLFGAKDKYEENDPYRKCSLKGLGDPDLIPLYPQTKADIMCMYIETAKDKFQRGSLIKNELNINKYTAREIGWEK